MLKIFYHDINYDLFTQFFCGICYKEICYMHILYRKMVGAAPEIICILYKLHIGIHEMIQMQEKCKQIADLYPYLQFLRITNVIK